MIDDSELLHSRSTYDPAKAREYYLRTRKLKGRKTGRQDDPSGVTTASKGVALKPTNNPAKSSEQLRQQAKERLAHLEKRLARLKELLAERVKQAKTRSGIKEPVQKKSTTDVSSAGKGSGHLSAKEKRDAAERAKKSYEKNKPHDKPKSLDQQIEDVQKQIKDIRAKLKKAAEEARRQTSEQSQRNDGSSKARRH